jgi:hypothetical protein
MTFAGVITRIGITVALAVSGISHAYLYIHGHPAHSDDRHCLRGAGQCLVRCCGADPGRRAGVAAVGRGDAGRRLAGSHSCCHAPSGCGRPTWPRVGALAGENRFFLGNCGYALTPVHTLCTEV